MIRQYGLQPFEINVVSLQRTFTEKVLALVRASYYVDPITDLQKKIRHIYDLHALLKQSEISTFMQGPAFFQSIQAVQLDDARSSEFQGEWASQPLSSCFLFRNPAESWPSLLPTYHNEFKSLVFGPLPDHQEVLRTLQQIAARLKAFDA
jgi:hypothetical protein